MTALLPPRPRWLKTIPSERPQEAALACSGRICAWHWTVLGLIVVAGMALFYHLGSYRTLSSHEVYAVVPAREMIENDNWVFPTFGGLPRLRKPPLAYWVVAGSAKLFGELSPLTARLPSAFAGLLLAGVVGLWANRWYGSRAGWAAAFVQLTSTWFVIFARKAEIDMVLCLFTTTALFLIADQPADEHRGRSFFRWLGVYVLLSLSWLAKFHYGAAMVLAPVIVFFLIERRWRQLKHLANPLGLLCLAAAMVIWPMLVLDYAPNAWEVWRRETLGRAVGEMGKHPVYYYLPFLIWLPMPWTPLALAAMPQSWRSAWKGRCSRERFLWVWFLTQLTIVTLSANKHQHYLMALFPMITLLAARNLSEMLHGFREGRIKISRRWLGWLIVMNLALSVLLLMFLPMKWPELLGPTVVLAITIGLCESAGWILLYRRQLLAMMAVNIINLTITGVVVIDWVVPHCDRRVEVEAFANEVRQNILPNEPVCVFRMDRDPLVYHLGSPVFRVECEQELQSQLHADGSLYVVGYASMIHELGPIAETHRLALLPKGHQELEPVEGDVVLVKLLPRDEEEEKLSLPSSNAN